MAIQNRYEFMYYVACTNSNPNGDPDMGNMPRIDPQTMRALLQTARPSVVFAITLNWRTRTSRG